MQKTINDFFNAPIRAEIIVHLGTMCVDDDWPTLASEAFEDDYEEVWAALELAEPVGGTEEVWSEAICDARKFGFLVKFSTPIPTHFYQGGHSFSWGFYTSFWIYDEDLENACVRALQWQEDFLKRKRAEAAQALDNRPQD